MAEFLGVLIGDGCISRFVSEGKVKFEIAFTGNPSELKYYANFLKPLSKVSFLSREDSESDGTTR
jgi:hypothetical protein